MPHYQLNKNVNKMATNYSAKDYNKENMARAIGRSLPISFKPSTEICNFIRHKSVNYAKDVLSKIIEHKQAIPFRRYNTNLGHKRKIGPGRYPKNASIEILKLINSVEANAQFKGMNTANLVITHINANKAAKAMHYGRKRSRWAKRTNLEIVVQEKAADKKSDKKEIKEGKKNFGEQKKEGTKTLGEKTPKK